MKFQWQKTVPSNTTLVDFIAAQTELSKSAIKKALNFGGGWLKAKGTRKLKRVRRATKPLTAGDVVAFYYDAKLLQAPIQQPTPILQTPHWGIWHKPADVPAQGTPFGDSSCMEYLVAEQIKPKPVYIVHRLDKEAAGLMLIAYSKQAAAALSALWPSQAIRKFYHALAEGVIETNSGEINTPLDGKNALTLYKVMGNSADTTHLEVEIKTGRFHQIRRHFANLGHPLLGDPKYGRGKGALQLVAVRLMFDCPISGQPIDCHLPSNLSHLQAIGKNQQ